MVPRRLLLLNAHALRAYVWQQGTLSYEQEFHGDGPGLNAFCAYLAQHPDSRFQILADIAEESFHLATLPAVRGRDRRALLARKLSQYCHGSTYATEIPLGRSAQGRRDAIVLFTALTRPSLLAPWLQACEANDADLAGLYSAPQLLAHLPPKLKLSDGPHLLLSLGSAGFRQTYFDRGRLTLSRLSALGAATTEERIAHCAEETRKLVRHLTGQGLFKPGEYVVASVLATAEEHSCWRQHCPDSAELRFVLVDIEPLGKSLGLAGPPAEAGCDPLLLHLLACNPPAQQFAPVTALSAHRVRSWKRTLNFAGGAFLAACLLLALPLTLHAWQILRATGLPDTSAAPTTQDARIAALALALHQVATPSPLPAWQHLSQALEAAPNVELDRLDWQLGRAPGPAVSLEIKAHRPTTAAAPETEAETLRRRLDHDTWRATLLDTPRQEPTSFSLRLEPRSE